jgi:DNA repair exonuclease SbcCD ATPase subunit
MNNNAHEINLVDTKILAQKKYLRDLTTITSAQKKEKQETINNLQEDIRILNESNGSLTSEITTNQPTLSEESIKVSGDITELDKFMTQFKTQQKNVVKQAKFFSENDICPTCEQDIDADTKQHHLSECKTKAGTIKDALEMGEKKRTSLDLLLEQVNTKLNEVREWQSKVNANTQEIGRINNNINRLQSEIQEIENNTGDLTEANEGLEKLRIEKEGLQEDKFKLAEQNSYNRVNAELLKDTGIKTKIIRQYLPVINQLTNKYLQILDFFVHFDLDGSFAETIRSRHRDAFSYDSFSEGEKQRIDLSLLFTWRQIAKMKNSVATNLLILDETFDSSLDEEGIENLMKIIATVAEDTNVFVISHKSELEDAAFERKLEFVKEKNFSKLKKSA